MCAPALQFAVDADYEQWCIADEQTPDDELQAAIDWACSGGGGADCSKIQMNQPCFYPNTLKDHASYAFNNYFQKFKHKGGSCYFKAAAMITELDPSKHLNLVNLLLWTMHIITWCGVKIGQCPCA